MTKEELEKEVTEYLNTQTLPKMDSIVYQVIKNLIFGFALPREKRIADLEWQLQEVIKDNDNYQADNERLEKENAELEAQIEKMKCCENCGKEFTKECAWWKRAEENRQINTCKDWEIKEKYYNHKNMDFQGFYNHHYYYLGYVEGAEPREKRIAELEQENAELKDYRLTTLAKQQTDMSKYALNLEHKLSWYDEQLTKAKELLRRFIETSNPIYFEEDRQMVKAEAELFLNSEVEK